MVLGACGGSTTGGGGGSGAASGGGGGSGAGSGAPFNGNLQNGPLVDAFVWFDLHLQGTTAGNGEFDSNEQSQRTDEDGNFSLSASAADISNGFTIVSITDDRTVDKATGAAYGAGFTFKAPQDASVVAEYNFGREYDAS